MTAFLRLFQEYRDLEIELRSEVSAHIETNRELDTFRTALDAERTKRISAETMASERRAEITRLIEQAKELRGDLANAQRERLKSLDAINLKLMEPRVTDPAPDMAQYHREPSGGQKNIVATMREIHHKADMALMQRFPLNGKRRPTMNESVPEEVA